MRTALIYAGIAWVAIQVVATVVPALDWPDWIIRPLVIAIIAGFPVAIVLSWIFDLSPERLRLHPAKTEAAKASDPISKPAPIPSTQLLGREDEVNQVLTLLRSGNRCVTITGTGGAGKTRLAIETARRAAKERSDGTAFVTFTAVSDPSQVMPTLAVALDVTEVEGRSAVDAIATRIADRNTLLVLDNLEHVLDATGDIVMLLSKSPKVQVLATSRSPLRISGETEVQLQPLALPPEGKLPLLARLRAYPGLALFEERAARVRPGFVLDRSNVETVLSICRKLDGLPLALELAAARVRVLQPEALLDRLDRALDVLTVGTRDLPERQRTLRATIDWSHSLLSEPEKRLFRRLAVFQGGWTLDAAEAVCYGEADLGSSLDEMESLVEKGLVQSVEGSERFNLLQTIREFARERLVEADEKGISLRHAEHYLSVSESIGDGIVGLTQLDSMLQADQESSNVLAALTWYRESAQGKNPELRAEAAECGMRICGSLWMYWHIRGQHLAAREWTEGFLHARDSPEQSLGRCRALLTAGLVSLTLGELEQSRTEFMEGVRIARAVGDVAEEPVLAMCVGVAHILLGRIEEARPWLDQSIAAAQRRGEDWAKAFALNFLALVEALTGNHDQSLNHYNEALAIQRGISDYEGAGMALGGLAALASMRGDHGTAVARYREALEAYETVGDRPEEARVLDGLAWASLGLEKADDARSFFVRSMQAYEEVGSVRGIGIALFGLAATHQVEGRSSAAQQIAAAAEVFSTQGGIVNVFDEGSPAPAYLAAARESLQPEEVERLTEIGRQMSVQEAVAFATEAS